MPYRKTIETVRQALADHFAAVDDYFDRPEAVRSFRPALGGWSIAQILEHVTLTNHFLLIVLRRWTEKALRRAVQGEPIAGQESDLAWLDVIGERGSFAWVRPPHMEPAEQPNLAEVRTRMQLQLHECLTILDRLGQGQGALCRVGMSVHGLGKIDLYQWTYFIAQHARRHVQQMQANERCYAEASP